MKKIYKEYEVSFEFPKGTNVTDILLKKQKGPISVVFNTIIYAGAYAVMSGVNMPLNYKIEEVVKGNLKEVKKTMPEQKLIFTDLLDENEEMPIYVAYFKKANENIVQFYFSKGLNIFCASLIFEKTDKVALNNYLKMPHVDELLEVINSADFAD